MHLYARMSVNFIYKLVLFPTIFFIAPLMFPDWISFHSLLPLVSLSGLFLLIGIAADETILPLLGNLPATSLGFLFMTTVVWLSKLFFSTVSVVFWGALVTGLMLGGAELIMHQWILKQRDLEKA